MSWGSRSSPSRARTAPPWPPTPTSSSRCPARRRRASRKRTSSPATCCASGSSSSCFVPMPAEPRPGLLLDRDGVLNVEVHRLHRTADLVLIPGVLAALAEIARWQVPVAVVSNQAGIGHGLYDQAACSAVNEAIAGQVEAAGGRIDAFFFCPHTPAARCACRKPAPGLLQQAAAALALDLRRSVLVGDKRSDLEAARAVGCGAVLVRTGYGRAEEAALRAQPGGLYAACADALDDALPTLARLPGRSASPRS